MNETPELLAALEEFAALAVCEVCGEVFDTRLEGGLQIEDAYICPAHAPSNLPIGWIEAEIADKLAQEESDE